MITRSITYAPESTRGHLRAPNVEHPQWILCRGRQEFPIADDSVLQSLAMRGRIQPDDFLVNVHRDSCDQAKEITALRQIFRETVMRRVRRFSPALARALAMLWRLRS